MEWISVKKMKPPEGNIFLTWSNPYIRTAEILYDEDGVINWLDGGFVFEGVTHWMPLPEPPKD